MATPAFQLGDVGITLRATIRDPDGDLIDLTGVAVVTYYFFKPASKTTVSRTGEVADGKTKYVTVAGDLDEPGTWKLQVGLEYAGGTVLRTKSAKFKVRKNL